MSHRPSSCVALLVALGLVAGGAAAAQAAPPSATRATARVVAADPTLAPTLENLRDALSRLVQADRELMPAEGSSTLRGADDALLDRRARARMRVLAGLDTLLALGAPGRTAIRALALDWPGVDEVRRAEVRAALVAHDATDALRVVERLAVTVPRDTQFLRWRAEALDALARAPEALRARQARFELAPDDPEAWKELLRAHEAAGTLPRLRESLGRLRLLYPDSRAVREHEIEVLHRLGRRDEAARIAADTTAGALR